MPTVNLGRVNNHFDRKELLALMSDFPSLISDVDEALKILQTRYQVLDKNSFSNALTPLTEQQFTDRFQEIPLKMHGYLFKDILSNAGSYRQASEPGFGRIMFGKGGKYNGSNPNIIDVEIKRAGLILTKETDTPKVRAIKFYQHFVRIHPFYEANGRIGRFMADVYLDYHKYRMSWGKLTDGKSDKWLRLLNHCHKRMGQDNYDQYFQYLFDYFDQFMMKTLEDG